MHEGPLDPQRLKVRLENYPLRDEILTVAFSGGRDSVALLSLLLPLQVQMGFKLHALHVNHHLSAHADHWQAFCERFCQAHALPLQVVHLDLQRRGGESLEALARAGRYQAFLQAAGRFVVLAHHMDDQAETFLLQALRGAGPKGLAGMPLQREWADKVLLRPLLENTRADINAWLSQQQLHWIDDDSNGDPRYRRNALRHQIVPELERIQPGAAQSLARAASHCAEASELMLDLALIDGHPQAARLDVAELLPLSPPRARNLLRSWLMLRGVRLPAAAALDEFLQQILSAAHDRQPQLPLDEGSICRFAGQLHWVRPWQAQTASCVWRGETQMRLPGWMGTLYFVEEGRGLDASRLHGCPIEIRARNGRERIKLAQQRPSQSLKNLFQQSAIAPWERPRWPLLYAGQQLIAVAGLAISEDWQARPGLAVRWEPD